MGRSDLFLKLEIVKKIIGVILLIITMRISVEAMAYSLLVSSVCSQIINSWPNRKLLNYGYMEQIKDIIPILMLSLGMGTCVYFIGFVSEISIVRLVIQVFSGAVIYVLGSVLFKIDIFAYLWNIVKGYSKR